MVAKLLLLACALSVAQPPDRSAWHLQPQLAQGQELVYSGTFTEEAQTPGVHFQRTYRMELHVCVLDAGPRKSQVAFLTVLALKANRPERDPSAPATTSVRLELAEVDDCGCVHGRPGSNLAVPLEGAPTAECGAFVETPTTRVAVSQFWEAAEPGRPPRTWRLAGTEAVAGATCVKLVGQQQSDDWNNPRADRSAWRRQDIIWLSPQLGIAYRVERVLERRDPAREMPTHRAVLAYELDSRLTYPGELFVARRQEIQQAQKFFEEASQLLREPTSHRAQIEAELKRIAFHLEAQPPTPYRKAVLQIQRRLEAARRGEVAPEASTEEATLPAQVAAVGRPGPDFVATNLLNGKSARLQRLLGRPLLICFYNPATETGEEVLRFAQGLCERHPNRILVLGMAVTDDTECVRKQHAALKLSFPVLDGNGLHLTYEVKETPRLVLMDAEGIVRGLYTGWGPQSSQEITGELQRLLPKEAEGGPPVNK